MEVELELAESTQMKLRELHEAKGEVLQTQKCPVLTFEIVVAALDRDFDGASADGSTTPGVGGAEGAADSGCSTSFISEVLGIVADSTPRDEEAATAVEAAAAATMRKAMADGLRFSRAFQMKILSPIPPPCPLFNPPKPMAARLAHTPLGFSNRTFETKAGAAGTRQLLVVSQTTAARPRI